MNGQQRYPVRQVITKAALGYSIPGVQQLNKQRRVAVNKLATARFGQ